MDLPKPLENSKANVPVLDFRDASRDVKKIDLEMLNLISEWKPKDDLMLICTFLRKWILLELSNICS